MSLDRWKTEKQIKKAKKMAIKQLTNEGSSYKLAKHLVKQALNRMSDNNGKDKTAQLGIEETE